MGQLQLCDTPNPNCPYRHRLEEYDTHCFDLGMGRKGYEVIGEDSVNHDTWLASVRGIGLLDVIANPSNLPNLPGYIPAVRKGSGKLFTRYSPEYVGVLLGDVVSPVDLKVATDVHKKLGIPADTKVILLGYGSDKLIENMWPKRHLVFERLASLGFVAATGINYSIWDNQPHAERLINIKRSLLTFEDWQRLGVPAVPHIYWYGHKDLDVWSEWLDSNPSIAMVAINLQTLKANSLWAKAMGDLAYFVGQLKRPMHFLISGPQTLSRINQLRDILPSVTLSNSYALRMAANGQLIKSDGITSWSEFFGGDRSGISAANANFYETLAEMRKAPASPNNIRPLIHSSPSMSSPYATAPALARK